VIHCRTARAFAPGASLRRFAGFASLFLFASAGGAAQTTADAAGRTTVIKTAVSSGNFAGFGRVMIGTHDARPYELDRIGNHAVLRFDPDVTLTGTPAPPRNVTAIEIDGPVLNLTFRPGTEVRSSRLAGAVALDIIDPGRELTPVRPVRRAVKPPVSQPLTMARSPELGGRSVRPAAGAPNIAEPAPSQPLPPPALAAAAPKPGGQDPDAQEPEPIEMVPTRQIPPGRETASEADGPLGLIARRVKLPKEVDGTAFVVPFNSTSAAASFRMRDNTYIVFDERRPVDLAALKGDPVFGAASVQLLPTGTVLRIPVPAALSIVLTQVPRGWRVAALTATPRQQPIAASLVDGHVNLAAEQPGDVVNLADPDTGATLLVGTQHRPGQGVATNRRSTEFMLRPTLQGVVVEPLSDTIALKQVPTGFTLTGGPDGLALSPPTGVTEALMDAAGLTRRLDFSAMQPVALRQRAMRQIQDAAAAPPLARGIKHHAAAESMLALGQAAEAAALLRMAAEQDPREAASPDTAAVTAVAALLAGRTAEADGLLDPRLDGSDEIALWRAVRLAMLDEGSPGAAAVFAATAPLAMQYPPPIRDHILPLIAETMVQGGEIAPAARLLGRRPNDPKLAYAGALIKQAGGETAEALSMLDALAGGRDQFDRARAAIRAVELRLSTGAIDKPRAADALDKLLYAWRGDARELALRERVALLRAQTGAWPAAAATLRQAGDDFPEQKARLQSSLKVMFAAMIRDRDEQHLSPIEFVSLVDENLELMPNAGDDQALEQSLADRLLNLDLPGRAKPVLEKLLKAANSAPAKARFGASLATLEAREGHDSDARTALDESEGRDLPPDLLEQRAIIRAGVVARLGDTNAAAATLVRFQTAPATEARAQILENASDWAGAAQAWADYAALTLPASGVLDENQSKTALRLTTATARANDDPGLAALGEKYGDRMGAGPLADMFHLLTAAPIRTTADVGRAKQEMNLTASVPAGLRAMKARLATP
jgi:hypothetical protein